MEDKGQKDDGGKLRFDLLPVEALEATARALTHGVEKYAARNWEKGLSYGRVYGALQRHLNAWWKGQTIDPDSGLHHLDCAGACLAMLQTYEARNMGLFFDDRKTL